MTARHSGGQPLLVARQATWTPPSARLHQGATMTATTGNPHTGTPDGPVRTRHLLLQGADLGPADPPVLAGREAVLGEVERFLAPAVSGRVLVVCGEPGIGKSTVWEAAVGLARSRGFAPWCARPSEAEAQLSFAGLADLLEAAGAGVLA